VSAEPLDPQLERSIRQAYERPVPVPALDPAKLLRALAAEQPPRRGWGWRSDLALSLPAAASLAAALLVVGILAGAALERRALAPASGAAPAASQVVHFALVAPRASRVAVVGDFNGWDPVATPMRKLRSGATWTAAIAVPEGRYAYAFVVDGRTWMPDPTAPLAPGDGFGHESSVLVVPASRSAS
jgi:hypothetical protein